MKSSTYALIERINSTQNIRELAEDDLALLAAELRSFLLHSVSRSGGHFAAGLGAIELTIALHFVFNTPYDRLVWDVGHQCYPHKILTGLTNLPMGLFGPVNVSRGYPGRPIETLRKPGSSGQLGARR